MVPGRIRLKLGSAREVLWASPGLVVLKAQRIESFLSEWALLGVSAVHKYKGVIIAIPGST